MQGWGPMPGGPALLSPVIPSSNNASPAPAGTQSRAAMVPHLSHADPWAHHFICCDLPHAASTSTTPPNSSAAASPFATPFMSPAVGQQHAGNAPEGAQGISHSFPIRFDLDSYPSASSLPDHRHTPQQPAFENVAASQTGGALGAEVALGHMTNPAPQAKDGPICAESAFRCDQADCTGADVCEGSAACSAVECCADPECNVACDADNCHESHPAIVDGCDSCDEAAGGISGEAALAEWACSKEGCKAIEQYVGPRLDRFTRHR